MQSRKLPILALCACLGASGLTYFAAMPSFASGPPDFVHGKVENYSAFLVSEDLTNALKKESNYVAKHITAQGLEVIVSAPPTDAERAAVDAESQPAAQAATFSKNHMDPAKSPHVPIMFRTVPNSMATLMTLTDRITGDEPSWKAKGIKLTSWGPDVLGDNVVVHLENVTDEAKTAIAKNYGGLVQVAPDNQSASGSDRFGDSPPWWGADKIYGPSSGCTSWFSTVNAYGADITPTAAHCGAGAWYSNGYWMGNTDQYQFGGPMDGQTIPVSSNQAYIYSDPTSQWRGVLGVAGDDPIGALTCTDGITDLEVCDVGIVAVNQTVSYNGATVSGMVFAMQEWGANAFSPGDSGGPVETTSGSAYTTAQGMILVHTANWSQGWYMPARTIDWYFGISVKTL